MNRNWMILFMFLLFLIEGTWLPFVIPDVWSDRLFPQLVFIVVLYHAVYKHRHTALMMGLGFGLLQDIVYYGHMIGPHTFSMGLLGYLAGLLFSTRNTSMMVMMMISFMGSFIYQTIIFGIYALFSVQHLEFKDALLNYMIPSLFIQLLFALIIYVPMRKWFETAPVTDSTEDKEAS
ncbi:MAG: rod shape-determining protein MreD [Paenibacillus sp.]|uniref:Rod shape-determining protein MreD n=1 Tax=Paenibacillus aquistagni TaxID=1852522 RepID=A0A1X7LW61_9BACL|nr:rod shape-determining protein MreD [Paenibacillus aquistagni]MBR2567742.1 rod shape-determining protein MreD [Paenibacillus sp.]NMM52200.1 rod shape-determining protein MreD [Paenibacillus aquistagni]SMG58085.1 rod shape-determining protein MreD [Paenibacillus aquistagni]